MNRWAAVFFTAFGLKGMYREAEEQRATLAQVRAAVQQVKSIGTIDGVVTATDEAGSFHREK